MQSTVSYSNKILDSLGGGTPISYVLFSGTRYGSSGNEFSEYPGVILQDEKVAFP